LPAWKASSTSSALAPRERGRGGEQREGGEPDSVSLGGHGKIGFLPLVLGGGGTAVVGVVTSGGMVAGGGGSTEVFTGVVGSALFLAVLAAALVVAGVAMVAVAVAVAVTAVSVGPGDTTAVAVARAVGSLVAGVVPVAAPGHGRAGGPRRRLPVVARAPHVEGDRERGEEHDREADRDPADHPVPGPRVLLGGARRTRVDDRLVADVRACPGRLVLALAGHRGLRALLESAR
jgi:hypothetical protein